MNYGEIKTNDVANGPGVRLSLFVSGCRNHCKGCFNPETWDFNYGEVFSVDTLDNIIKELGKPQYQGLTILGGDPLEPENIICVANICDEFKKAYPNKDIWLYTGYTIEERYKYLKEMAELDSYNGWLRLQGLIYILRDYVDVVVDGPFIEEQKNLSLKFRGSKNQRIIDMNKTRKEKEVVLWEEES